MRSTTDVPTGEDTLSGNWTLCTRQSVILSMAIDLPYGPSTRRQKSIGGFSTTSRTNSENSTDEPYAVRRTS